MNDVNILTARRALKDGLLIHLPTETVYGLAGRCDNEETIAAIFALKGRPSNNPLIVHVADTNLASELCYWDERADLLARHFWPGPLSIVLPARESKICLTARAGLNSVALRCPSHEMAQCLLKGLDFGVVAPSANRSGRPSPTDQASAYEETGQGVTVSLDGGPCLIGIESSVVSLVGDRPSLLRSGCITKGEIEALIGPLTDNPEQAHLSPGRLSRHYAPKAPLMLNCITPPDNCVYLGFGDYGSRENEFNLSPSGDLAEVTHNLFRHLRRADSLNPKLIAVAPIPHYGIGEAINDRLKRAAGYVG